MFVSGFGHLNNMSKNMWGFDNLFYPLRDDLSYCYREEIASLALALSAITRENSKEMYGRPHMPHALSNFLKSPTLRSTFRWSFQQTRFYSFIANF